MSIRQMAGALAQRYGSHVAGSGELGAFLALLGGPEAMAVQEVVGIVGPHLTRQLIHDGYLEKVEGGLVITPKGWTWAKAQSRGAIRNALLMPFTGPWAGAKGIYKILKGD